MVVMRVKRPATKEEMELFICLGNRLQVFKTVKVITKNGVALGMNLKTIPHYPALQ